MTRLVFLFSFLCATHAYGAPVQTNYDYGYPDVSCSNIGLGVGGVCTFQSRPVTGYSTYTLTLAYTDFGVGGCTGYTVAVEGAVRKNPDLNTTLWGNVTTTTITGGTVALNPMTISRTIDATETSHFTFAGPYYLLRATIAGIGGCGVNDKLSVILTITNPN